MKHYSFTVGIMEQMLLLRWSVLCSHGIYFRWYRYGCDI